MAALEEKLDALIARDEGVAPSEVTLQFIRSRRQEKVAGDQPVEFETVHGGHVSRKRVLTNSEAAEARRAGWRFLNKFASK